MPDEKNDDENITNDEAFEEIMRIREENLEKLQDIKKSMEYQDFHNEITLSQKSSNNQDRPPNFLIEDAINHPTAATEFIIEEMTEEVLGNDPQYKAMMTEIDDSKYDVKNEDKIEEILKDDYFRHVEYPQIENEREFTNSVIQSELPFDVQSVLTDFSSSTEIQLGCPELSFNASKIFSEYEKSPSEVIDLNTPEDEYIKCERNERLLQERIEAIDSTIQYIHNDISVLPLKAENIKPYLVEYYADPANFDEEEMKLPEEEQKLEGLIASIRLEAEEMATNQCSDLSNGEPPDECATEKTAIETLKVEMDEERAKLDKEKTIQSEPSFAAIKSTKSKELLEKADSLCARQPKPPLKKNVGNEKERPTSAKIRAILGKIE